MITNGIMTSMDGYLKNQKLLDSKFQMRFEDTLIADPQRIKLNSRNIPNRLLLLIHNQLERTPCIFVACGGKVGKTEGRRITIMSQFVSPCVLFHVNFTHRKIRKYPHCFKRKPNNCPSRYPQTNSHNHIDCTS